MFPKKVPWIVRLVMIFIVLMYLTILYARLFIYPEKENLSKPLMNNCQERK